MHFGRAEMISKAAETDYKDKASSASAFYRRGGHMVLFGLEGWLYVLVDLILLYDLH